jgi:RND family efflux transporter MFP subunit
MSWLAMLLVGCGGPANEAPPDPGPALLAAEDVAEVRSTRIVDGPRLSGTLEAAEKAVLRAEAPGSVSEVHAELGDTVATGALLARIENDAIQTQAQAASSALVAAELELGVAERELERTRTLVQAGALSTRDLDLADANAKGARARANAASAQAAAANDQLDAIVLRSPIDGVVSERSIYVGDVVAPGAPLFTVIDPSSLRLEASVSAEAVGTIARGVPVEFEVQGFADRTFQGTMERVAPAVDPATRQIDVLVSIPNPEGVLLAGLFAEGRVATSRRDALVIPLAAVDVGAARPTVLRVVDGKVESVEVDIGIVDETEQQVEVLSGLAAGDQVIVGAARDVEPGRAVRVDVATADAEG